MDTSRPAAAAGTIGTWYEGSDTAAVYVGNSTTTWLVASADMGPDRCSIGTLSDSNYLISTAGSAAPTMAPGQSLIFGFWAVSTPAAYGIILYHADNFSRGFQLEMGRNAGAMTEFSAYWYGLNSGNALQMTGSGFGAGSGAMHVFGMTFVASSMKVHWCLDGGAVSISGAIAGTYAPPTSSDYYYVGRALPGGYPMGAVEPCFVLHYSTEVSDADLQTGTAAGIATAGRPVALGTGTISMKLAAAMMQGRSGQQVVFRQPSSGSSGLIFSPTGTIIKTAR